MTEAEPASIATGGARGARRKASPAVFALAALVVAVLLIRITKDEITTSSPVEAPVAV